MEYHCTYHTPELHSIVPYPIPYTRLLHPTKKTTVSPVTCIKKEPKKTLSRILRTEYAIKGIERKATTPSKQTQPGLWPKSVLEALDEAIATNHWDSALKIFELLRKQRWYKPRCQTYTKLIVMLGKCKQPAHAGLLFEKMQLEGLKPTIDVYTSLVSAYGLSGYFNEAFGTVEEMKSVTDCKPDAYTYSILINCCSKFRRFDLIDKVLDEMSYHGINLSVVTYNTIIDGYGKAEMFELMENSLTDMIQNNICPDVYTLNSFIWAYGNVGMIKNMESWYDEFQLKGVQPDIKTFNILIRSYGKAGMHDKMETVMDFMIKRFFSPSTVTYNIIIEMFGRAGHIVKMEHHFRTMKYKGIKPNAVTYSSLVSSYSKAGELEKIHSIIRQVENSDVILDTPFFNCVISAYGKAGKLTRMEDMFLEMKHRKCKPDHITFETMIQAYNSQGLIVTAQELETSIKLNKTEYSEDHIRFSPYLSSSDHTSGALAGSAATIGSYPFDLLHTLLASQGKFKEGESVLLLFANIEWCIEVINIFFLPWLHDFTRPQPDEVDVLLSDHIY